MDLRQTAAKMREIIPVKYCGAVIVAAGSATAFREGLCGPGEAEALLPQVLEPDSTVLVKASRGMKLEALTQRLLELAPEE